MQDIHDDICGTRRGCECNCAWGVFNALGKEKERLMRYARQFGSEGNWLVNQDDCIPALESLESDGEIERDGDYRWRLAE